MKANFWRKIGVAFLWIILLAGLVMPGTPAVALSTSRVGSSSSEKSGQPLLPANVSPQTHIEKDLLLTLQNLSSADFIITMAEQADVSAAEKISDWNQRGEFVYNTLLQTAQASQAKVIAELQNRGLKYQSFIIGNEIYVYGGNMAAAVQLNSLPDVADIRSPITVYLEQPLKEFGPLKNTATHAVTDASILAWGITDAKANLFWSNYTMQGEGIVVANIDTGVQWDHPALVNQFKCDRDPTNPACWFDPANICGAGGACDNNGHGTHTMGTMVATNSNNALPFSAGMAPHAQWIACKGCETNNCSEASLNACADWILAPGGNANNRPNIVNNSWGDVGGNAWFQAKVQAWRAAGIFPTFSAGNKGPTCGTLGSPGDYQESFSSAAHDSSRTIASFSSRGPSTVFGSTPFTKPNISAPGVSVCSSVPGSGWGCSSGTSMASPHSAGAVALLWSCNNSLIGQIDQTMQVLQNSADAAPAGTCGAPPSGQGNNTYGYGYLDANAAGALACSLGSLTGTVSDASGALAGAQVTATNTNAPYNQFKTSTGAGGAYSMVLPSSTYNVTAIYGSDAPGASDGVAVGAGAPTPLDFNLSAGAPVTLSGTVSDSSGHGYPLYAGVDVTAPGFSIKVYSDPFTGAYQVTLYQGVPYDLAVKTALPGYTTGSASGVVFNSSAAVRDFGLQVNSSSCTAPGNRFNNGWIEAFDSVTPPLLPEHWVSIPVVGADAKWETASISVAPADIPVHSPPNLVHFNSFSAALNDTARLYNQAPVNMTAVAAPRLTFWMYHEKMYSSSNDRVQPQVSTDGGVTWINAGAAILRYDGTSTWTQHTVDLSAYAGQSNLLIGLYATSGYGNDINIDDIVLGDPTCQPLTGGLVAGLVSDAYLGTGLVDVNLSSDTGAAAVSTATPEDANLPDGLYWLFQPTPPAAHVITAAEFVGYASLTHNVTVVDNAVTRQDFEMASTLVPVAPDSLTATPIYQTRIDLSWHEASPEVAGFKIERSPDGATGWVQIGVTDGSTTTFANSGLSCGTTYFYRVLAYNASGNSAYSATASAAAIACSAIPSPPSKLTGAGVSPVEIDLAWKVNSTSETSFKVERSPDGTNSWALIASTTAGASTYANKNLLCGTTYFYRVRAYGALGYSAYSNIASAPTQTCPETPSLTAAGISTTQITLTWVDSASNMTSFKVERSPDGINGWVVIAAPLPTVRTFTNTSLTCGTPYYYRVRAYYGTYYSAYSNIANTATQACLETPSLTAAGISTTQIMLTWVDSASDMTSFKVERSPNGTSGWTVIAVSPPTSRTFTNTNLICGTPYYYRVRAYYGTYYSAYSNIASPATQACPATPSLTAAGASPAQITLTWVDSDSDMTKFYVERSPTGTNGWVVIATPSSTARTFTNTSLTCSTTYYYRIRAYYGTYYSAYSNIASPATQACPETPSSLTAAGISTTQIGLDWVDTASDMTSFKVERSSTGTSGWTVIAVPLPTARTFTNTSLTCATTYYYRVRAYYGTYYSAYSNTAYAITLACPN